MNTKTKRAKILAYLQSGRPLTPMQAITWWKATRLADDVYQLKKKGYVIYTEMVKGKSGGKYARYHMDVTASQRALAA